MSSEEISTIDLADVPQVCIDGTPYDLRGTERTHRKIVQASNNTESSVAIITPTLHTECLENYALSVLFEQMANGSGEDPVFIVTPDTSVRDRYENLSNDVAIDTIKYSESRWPLSTVKANGELTYRTKHNRDSDAPPRVIFTRFSTRQPKDEISKDIQTVMYDDRVKYERERWERFNDWVSENNINNRVYFISDPVGPVYQSVKDDVETLLAWGPKGLQSVCDEASELSPDVYSLQSSVRVDESTVPSHAHKNKCLLHNKIEGQEYTPYNCSEGEFGELIAESWSEYENLKDNVDKSGTDQLYRALGVGKRAINTFTRMLSGIKYSNKYRGEHRKAVPIPGYIDQLGNIKDNLDGESELCYAGINKLHRKLEQLYELCKNENEENGKFRKLMGYLHENVSGDNKNKVIVLLPDEPARDAFRANMAIEYEEFFRNSSELISLETPRDLPNADPADCLVLYGAPKVDHRWVIRTAHAPSIDILLYEHEIGLLYSQVKEINKEIKQATPTENNQHINKAIQNNTSLPEMINQEDGPTLDSYSKLKSGRYCGVSIDFDNPVDIDGRDPTTNSGDKLIDGATGPLGGGDSYSNTSGTGHNYKSVDDCVKIVARDGSELFVRLDEEIDVVGEHEDMVVGKDVTDIHKGEEIISVRGGDYIREKIMEILGDSGHYELVVYARLWKNKLETEIEKNDDSLEEFIEKLEQNGLNMVKQTYKKWYNGEVNLTREKPDLKKIMQAYNMDDVLDDLEKVWDANHKIWNMKRKFKKKIKEKKMDQLTGSKSDPIIDNELDIRLSDFDTTDKDGNEIVQIHTVDSVDKLEKTVSTNNLGTWR